MVSFSGGPPGVITIMLDLSQVAVIIRGIMPTPNSADQASAPISIRILNCNNLESADITLTTSALNIKYGPNGIGKSTIARALALHTKGDDALKGLLHE